MTMVLKNHKSNNYYICLEVENNCYVVEVCPLFKDNMAGYPIRKMTYSLNEKEKAYNTFRRYKKKYI